MNEVSLTRLTCDCIYVSIHVEYTHSSINEFSHIEEYSIQRKGRLS